MRLFSPLAANLLLIVGAVGLGGLLRPLFPRTWGRLDRLATIVLGGLGLLGTLLFLIGLLRFSRAVILSILIACVLLGFVCVRQEARGLRREFSLTGIPILPASVIALVLITTFLGGIAEPVGDIKLDAISYHFLGPSIWLRDAVIHPLPDEAHASFPAIVETLFAALMAVGGTRGPELFAFLSLSLLLVVTFGLARRMELNSRDAWWAVALVATMPVVYRGAYGGFNDAILAGFCLLTLRFALDAVEWKDYALAGIFAGLAMGTKYTAIISFGLILGCAVLKIYLTFTKEFGKRFGHLLLFIFLAAAIAAPWYLRNWWALGSPIYPPPPVLLRFFTVKYMSPESIQALAALIRKEGDGMGHNFSSFLLLPIHFTYHPANFLNGAGGVGLALLALTPFGIWMFRRELFVKVLLIFIFLQTVAWFVTEQEARFLIHLYVIFAIFTILGWRYATVNAPRFGPLLSGVAVACSILYGAFMIVSSRVDDVHAAISSNFERQRITREVPFLETFTYLNNDPEVRKVLVVAPRFPTFYLHKNYLKPIGRYGEESIPGAVDTPALLQNSSSLGITHVVDVRVDGNDFQIQQKPTNLTLVLEREDQRVYRVIVTR
jgi:hypothetical protein